MLSDTVTLYTTPDKGRTSHPMFPTATRDATEGNNAKNSDSKPRASCREPWALEPGSLWVRYTWIDGCGGGRQAGFNQVPVGGGLERNLFSHPYFRHLPGQGSTSSGE